MRFKTEIEGVAAWVDFFNGPPRFRCDVIDGTFETAEALEKAIKAYDLALRKQFKNRTAYMYDGYSASSIKQVEVTSVTGDGEAWIKRDNKREKVSIHNLFPDQELLQGTIAADNKINAQRKALWDALPRWKPEN